MGVVRAMTRDALKAGCVCACAKTAATCRELLKVEAALWTFLRVEGVESTNNAAEQALRHAVQWRETSYGTDSQAGFRSPDHPAQVFTLPPFEYCQSGMAC
jgi:transposase